MNKPSIGRRTFLKGLGAGLIAAGVFPESAYGAEKPEMLTKEIPSSGENIPVVGMGTWQTFNVGGDSELRDERTEILRTFFELGGRMVDSSPMYGSSQDVVGYGLEKLDAHEEVFSADKVWTRDGGATRSQAAASADKWNVDSWDLMQIHNLLAWEEHLETLREMKSDDEVGYIGVTTSHGRRHDELEKIMKNEEIDFVQLTYNLVDREAENRLLPVAREREIAVIANRPFRGGSLVDRVQTGHSLPDWASEFDAANWPQFLLKFIVSHPAITCAIPATTQLEHMRENMGAARGRLPDAKTRKRMARHVESL